MELIDLAKTGGLNLPWPVLINGTRVTRTALGESDICQRKCGVQPQCASTSKMGENVCEYGLSYFSYLVLNNQIIVYGLRGPKNNTKFNAYTRTGIKGRSVTNESINEWIGGLKSLLEAIENKFLSRQAEMLDPLHDSMRLAKQISTIANHLVMQISPGEPFERQIECAPPELKTLVKASDLLSDSFDLLSIYFNPAAASFGRRTSISLHGLLTKLVSIFRIDDNGFTRSSTKIFFNGSCYRNAFVFESFKLIPLALLSNAVKYTMSGNIDVSIVDRQQVAEISFESTGPHIEESERLGIFQKKGRGKWASKLADGRGVGLYLANIIANAHSFEIKVQSRKTGVIQDGIPLASNRFYFEVPYQG